MEIRKEHGRYGSTPAIGYRMEWSAPSLKQSLPQPTNATKKPLDSSARKSLIYIGVTGVPSGLRPSTGGECRRENTQTESKTRRLLAEMHLSVVRESPQEPAQTRGSRQKKANRLVLAFKVLGWRQLKDGLKPL